jgi:hypothetical protein
MAQDDNNPEVEIVEGLEDNAKGMTSALVITTTVVLFLAFIVMEMALGKWFKLGPLA